MKLIPKSLQNTLSLKNWMDVSDEIIENSMRDLQIQHYLNKMKWITGAL